MIGVDRVFCVDFRELLRGSDEETIAGGTSGVKVCKFFFLLARERLRSGGEGESIRGGSGVSIGV